MDPKTNGKPNLFKKLGFCPPYCKVYKNLDLLSERHRLITIMETVLRLTKALERLSEILENVQHQNHTYIISRHGRR